MRYNAPMARALTAAFFLSIFALSAPAHAQNGTQLSLSLIRAVRLSDTSITISFKTSAPAIGQVLYSATDGSKFTLTDSVPQTDHLFTIEQLDRKHGYSFALSANGRGTQSDTYMVLLSPESIGVPGTSLMPRVQETDATGNIVSIILAASSTPAPTRSIVPWWAFVLFFVLIVGGWMAYKALRHRLVKPLTPPSF